MPVYTYTALNERGKSIKGIISADSARQGRNKLRQLHFYLTRLTEIEKADTQERGRGLWGLFLLSHIRQQDLTLMTRQFATLIAAQRFRLRDAQLLGQKRSRAGVDDLCE